MERFVAYHNDPKVKQEIMDQLQEHYRHDEIIQGTYWQDGKGCAVGCTIHSDDHMLYEPQFGIPVALALIEDELFESLSNDKAKEWPIAFMSAIQPGQDLSMVSWRLLYWTMTQDAVFDSKFDDLFKDVEELFSTWFTNREFSVYQLNQVLDKIANKGGLVCQPKLRCLYSVVCAMHAQALYDRGNGLGRKKASARHIREAIREYIRICVMEFTEATENFVPKLCDQLLAEIRAAPMATI